MITKEKVNRNRACRQLVAALLGSAILSGTASAAETNDKPNFVFDQILVTAQRYEKNDVDTPASASVVTGAQIQATGAKNAQEALTLFGGFTSLQYGAGGASQGSMTSKVIMRGVYNGTLVLINGTPLNLRGLYNLEDIPVEDIERIEIVKGGGSVLYGSEAAGGVINIITKAERQNSVKVSGVIYGQQNHSVDLQLGKLGFGYHYDKWGNTGKVSSYVTSGKEMYNVFDDGKQNNCSLNYNFDSNWSLLYNHNDADAVYNYTYGAGYAALENKTRYTRKYSTAKDFAQLQYKNKGQKFSFYYNNDNLKTDGTNYYSSANALLSVPDYSSPDTEEKNRTYGFDLQQDWFIHNNKLLMGVTYQNEYYKPDITKATDYARNNYSLYGQWEHPASNADTMILSARETWTGGTPHDRNYDNFSAQGQFIHKLNENESLYGSIGQSFKMPTFNQIYGSGSTIMVGNPSVKPQTGIHYEMGWKKNTDTHKWRLALFNYYIKDNITSEKIITTDQYKYTNEDLKNTGIELTCDIAGVNGWSYNWGISYGNPESKTTAKPYWDRAYGRFQLNGGATYQQDKWRVALTESYLADRVMTPSSSESYSQKPYLLTSLNVTYNIDKHKEIFFTANNILDREDVISHSSSEYYDTPFNYTLGYKVTF